MKGKEMYFNFVHVGMQAHVTQNNGKIILFDHNWYLKGNSKYSYVLPTRLS